MSNNRTVRKNRMSRIWLMASFAAGALTAQLIEGTHLRPIDPQDWPTLVPAVGLALMVVLGIHQQWRSRSAQRLSAALDAYAERELARARTFLPSARMG